MDIVSHAIAGAATGHAFGNPVAGAVFAILPDVVLGIRRHTSPPTAYDITHSLLFTCVVGCLVLSLFGTWVAFFALLSHLVLDIPTHGSRWGPTLFYPAKTRISYGWEWEWFSRSWFIGLFLTIFWSLSWFLVL